MHELLKYYDDVSKENFPSEGLGELVKAVETLTCS